MLTGSSEKLLEPAMLDNEVDCRASARQPAAARLWALLSHNLVHWEVTHCRLSGTPTPATEGEPKL